VSEDEESERPETDPDTDEGAAADAGSGTPGESPESETDADTDSDTDTDTDESEEGDGDAEIEERDGDVEIEEGNSDAESDAPASDDPETPGGLDSVMEGSNAFPDTEDSEAFPETADPDSPSGMDAGDATNGASEDGGGDGEGSGTLFDDDAFSAESLGTAEPGPGTDAASPFDELESDVGDAGSADVDFDRLFEEMSAESETEGIDEEWVWDELEGGSPGGAGSGEEHIVPTRAFCAQCEHVADPPEVQCTYEGSEIIELVDKDNVRVRGCPIVEQRQLISEME
jgi:hypothetical protein